LWVRGSHELHENWATTNSNDSTIFPSLILVHVPVYDLISSSQHVSITEWDYQTLYHYYTFRQFYSAMALSRPVNFKIWPVKIKIQEVCRVCRFFEQVTWNQMLIVVVFQSSIIIENQSITGIIQALDY
jgi:hypothetical protein